MILLRSIGFLFVFFVMPPLGYLTAATVWTHLGDQVEVSSAAQNEILIGIARSCERQEPITLTGGFKTWYICQVDVSAHRGPSRTMESRGFLTPADIGKPVPVDTTHRGRDLVADSDYLRYPTLAPLAVVGTVIGWVLLMAFMLWALSGRHMPRLRSSPEEIAAHVRANSPPDEEQPRDEAYVRGRRKWLKGSWVFGLLVLSVLGAVVYSGDAFEGDTTQTVLAVASWSTPVLLFLNALRKLFFWPAVTISPTGMDWTTDKPTWAEIERVQLSARHVLTVHRVGGPPQKVGRFGPEQADEINRAMRKYGKTTAYQREARVASPA